MDQNIIKNIIFQQFCKILVMVLIIYQQKLYCVKMDLIGIYLLEIYCMFCFIYYKLESKSKGIEQIHHLDILYGIISNFIQD